MVGGIIGGIVGGIAGNDIATPDHQKQTDNYQHPENHPEADNYRHPDHLIAEDKYWRDEYQNRPYFSEMRPLISIWIMIATIAMPTESVMKTAQCMIVIQILIVPNLNCVPSGKTER